MRWARRRHQRARKQFRKNLAMYEEANRNEDFTALTRLEKLVPFAQFAHAVQEGMIDVRTLSPSLRRRVQAAALTGMLPTTRT
jgi:hypothetical protein